LFYTSYLKRSLDTVISILLVFSLSPVFVICSLCVLWSLGRPILFKQRRIGINSVPFTIFKFRTMLDEDDNAGRLRTNAERLTLVGKAFRKTSLDELPGLFNVIKGDMSLIGPRPLLVEYLGRFSERQAIRHSIRPGMTGLAQVSGRNHLGWKEKLELDIQYVEKRGILLDTYILGKTLITLVLGSGVDVTGEREMPNFRSE
jgi:lipopolysaccharide/colanic/teichoic acid biosynthesis glycosyltransferase